MSSKKKSTIPQPFKKDAPEPKPKYNIGQKVFLITYHRGLPENIFEVKITGRSTWEHKLLGIPGEKNEFATAFRYGFHCDSGLYTSVASADESTLYQNFAEAAKVFAKAFLVLLK